MNIQKKKIHTADIKDIICNDKEIITCSRDGTINILDHELVVRKTLKPNNGFVNAIAKFENHLFAGLQSGLILHYTLEKDYDSFSGNKFLNNDDEKEKDDKEKNITNVYDGNVNDSTVNDSNGNERIINDSNGNERIINDSNINDSNGNDTNENDFYDPEFISVHSQNVTSLKLTTVNIFGSFAESIDIPKNNFYLVSASWDSKVCILDFCNGRVKFLKFAQGVWNVQIHGGRLYVCGIDKMIYMYEDGMNVGVYALHTSCVRSLCVGLGSLYSLSNDGKVFRWENGLKNCRDLQNISYSLAIFPGKKCVCEQSPGVSTCRCGIVAAAGEKNVTFLSSDLKFLKKIILGVECWTVSATGNLVLVGGGDGNLYVFELDELMKRPEKVIRVPVELTDGEETIKIINEMVYKKSSDQWELIGSVANNTHAFEVEVDGRLLKLTFTDDENTFAIAERFLREHKLGDSYKDD
ncbi:Ubiquitin homeostasis protein lub1, partial [Dictyocoela roeselum]